MENRQYFMATVATWAVILLSALGLASYFAHQFYAGECEREGTRENYRSSLGYCKKAWMFGWPIQWFAPAGYRSVLNNLGLSEMNGGQLEAAKAHLTDVMVRRELVTPEGSRELAITLNNLAILNQELGDLKQSEALYRRSIEMFGRVAHPCDSVAAQAGSGLGSTLNALNRVDEAETVLLERVKRNDACKSLPPETKGVTLRILAGVQTKNGEAEEALISANSAIRLLKEAYGEESLELARALAARGSALLDLRRPEEAEKSVKLALPMFERFVGAESVEEASSRSILGSSLRDREMLAEAMAEYTTAYKVYLARLGENHPWRATLLMHMAKVTRALGRKPEALGFLREAERIQIAVFGGDSPEAARARRAMTDLVDK